MAQFAVTGTTNGCGAVELMKIDLIMIPTGIIFISTKGNHMHSVTIMSCMRRMVQAIVIASLLFSAGCSSSVLAETTNNGATQPTKAEMDAWSEAIKHIPKPAEGCFHISYPNLTWTKIDCGPEPTYRATPLMHPLLPPPRLQKPGDPVQ